VRSDGFFLYFTAKCIASRKSCNGNRKFDFSIRRFLDIKLWWMKQCNLQEIECQNDISRTTDPTPKRNFISIYVFKNGLWPVQFQYPQNKCVCVTAYDAVWIDMQVLTFWWSLGLPPYV